MVDRPYWDGFYREALAPTSPSPFAHWCLPWLAPGARVVELGCGNGRDSLFFARQGHPVVAVDSSAAALAALSTGASGAGRVRAVLADMSTLADGELGPFDVAYYRFSLHAVTRAQASASLAWAARGLSRGGLVCIEARSAAGPPARVNGHFRRPVRADDLRRELQGLGLEVLTVLEGTGFSPFGEDDPVLVRLVARRTTTLGLEEHP